MDFFESQDAARRSSGRLLTLFALAIVSIILSVYTVVAGAFLASTKEIRFWHPGLFLAVVAVTVVVVACGSLYKIAQLAGGGRVVAESMGGRLVPHSTSDPDQRKILNVVEEMAIASGTPVPPVYLMQNEEGINAFAAGYTPEDAVIGVTRGCIEQLSRAELQGVIGHEFSHILNGDMRMNIRLIGLLNGILVIGIIGYFILRGVGRGTVVRSRGKDKGGGAVLAILAIGAGLAVVGFMGTLFGNLIKAAVSRQRELLADASSVQFTRDPGSIAGALKRIGGMKAGSSVKSPHAAEASHMFFAKALSSGFASLFATHPPLEVRIRRIEPAWDGTYPPPRTAPAHEPSARPPAGRGADIARVLTGAAILAGAGTGATSKEAVGGAVSQVGRPSMAHVDYAAALVRSIPEPVAQAAREPYGARAVIHALLMSPDADVRSLQLQHLARHADGGVHDLAIKLLPHVEAMAPEARLPLVDLCSAALRGMTPSQYATFRANFVAMIEADRQISLFEWVLQRIIMRHLEPHFGGDRQTRAKHRSLDRLGGPCAILLSVLSHVGQDDPAAARSAFEKGRARLGLGDLEFVPRERCSLAALDGALGELDTAAFTLKRDLLEAAAACVSADRQVTVVEGELLRGIADSLGCPMPPLLPGQPIA